VFTHERARDQSLHYTPEIGFRPDGSLLKELDKVTKKEGKLKKRAQVAHKRNPGGDVLPWNGRGS
jgi:hypothetical protein